YQYPAMSNLKELGSSAPPKIVIPESMHCSVHGLYEDSHGNVWIATLFVNECGSRIFFWNRKTARIDTLDVAEWKLARSPLDGSSSFGEDHSGNMWIGLYGKAGLLRVRQGRIELFTPHDGVPAGTIHSLLVDHQGSVWIASEGGLGRVDRPDDP